ncbi:MAG: TolC family protein [Acidobacteriota bacterium]
MRGSFPWIGRVTLATALAALLASQAGAQSLSLAEAMAQARAGAREVKAAAARAEAAAARVEQVKGFRLPSVALQGMFVSTDSPAEAFAFKLNQERFSFAEFMVADPNNPSRLETGITRLEVQLPVYTGGELSGRIAQAEHAAEAAGQSRSRAADEAALAAAEAYLMLKQAQEFAALLERARATVAAHVELARAYADQGMLVTSEVMRAEVELARLDDMVAKARGDVAVASANLAFRLGRELEASWALAPLPVPPPLAEELPQWLEWAASRADLRAAEKLLAAGELEAQVRRAAYLPRVGVVARGDLVDDVPFGTRGRSATLMAVASLNLFAGGSDRAAVAAARWEAAAGREDVERFRQGVRLQVKQAFEEARTATLRQQTALRALAAARETERITEERFRAGIVKMIDLLDAATARREAETRELVARTEAMAARLRLAVAAGRAPESVL